MKKVISIVSKVSNHALFKAAAFMLILGASAVARCMVPFWHNEPEMPKSMLNEIE